MQIVKSQVVSDVLQDLTKSITLLNNELHQQIRYESELLFPLYPKNKIPPKSYLCIFYREKYV